jgi:hypothetical protein
MRLDSNYHDLVGRFKSHNSFNAIFALFFMVVFEDPSVVDSPKLWNTWDLKVILGLICKT